MSPWIFFLMIGVFDFGFYAHAAISTQNAARVAALAVGSGTAADVAAACEAASLELANMPNAASFGTCGTGSPLNVSIGPGATTDPPTIKVSVTYTGASLFAIPGIFDGKLKFTRSVEVPADYGD